MNNAKRLCHINCSTKIGGTDIQITKFNFEMQRKKTTTGAMQMKTFGLVSQPTRNLK